MQIALGFSFFCAAGLFCLSGCASQRSIDGYQGWPDILEYYFTEYGKPDVIEDRSASLGRYRRWGERAKYRWVVHGVVLYYQDSHEKIEIEYQGYDFEKEPMTAEDREKIASILDN